MQVDSVSKELHGGSGFWNADELHGGDGFWNADGGAPPLVHEFHTPGLSYHIK